MRVLEISGLHKTFGESTAVSGVELSVDAGEVLVLLGPSGCGKTTTLRCVAGLETADNGSIQIGARRVYENGRNLVPAESRRIGMVFQSYALWPHMTVLENVSYALRMQGQSKSAWEQAAKDRLQLVGLWDYRERLPNSLSGGQQQRVALARSLVGNPDLLLFDEPLSNLDTQLRESMRLELRRLVKELGVTGLYVTHDRGEALAIADKVAVMHKGRIVQIGSSVDIYERPTSSVVAQFLGTINVLKPDIAALFRCAATGDSGARWGIRAEHVQLARSAGGSTMPRGVIRAREYLGTHTIYKIQLRDEELTAHTPASFAEGDEVAISLDSETGAPLGLNFGVDLEIRGGFIG